VVLKAKEKVSESDFYALRNYLLLSLYALQKPRRNRDYQDMIVVSKSAKSDTKMKSNVVDLMKNKFIFNNFKTMKTYKSQVIPITEELREIIDIYLKVHPTCRQLVLNRSNCLSILLVNHTQKIMTLRECYTRYLTIIR
jgi:hypothetical protein